MGFHGFLRGFPLVVDSSSVLPTVKELKGCWELGWTQGFVGTDTGDITGDSVSIMGQSCHPVADVPCGTRAVLEVTPVKSDW